MKFTIGSNELKGVLKDISGVFRARETIESFRLVKITCKGNELCFAAQNSTYSIERRITYSESGGTGFWDEGEALVQGDMLRQFSALLPSNMCSIETKNGTAILRSGGSRVTLMCWQGESKPFREAMKEGRKVTLPHEVLVQALKAVKYARAGAQEARDWMKGILLSSHATGVSFFTAMDGFRLAMRKVFCATENDFCATLPAEVCDSILAISGSKQEGDATFIFSDTGVTYHGTNVMINSGLIAGTWPDVKALFPSPHKIQIECRIPRKVLLEAAERANILSAGKGVIRLEVRRGGLWVQSHSEMGESLEEVGGSISFSHISGDNETLMSIGLNPRYLREVLSAMGTEEIQMNMTGDTSPIVVYPVDGTEERHLLLPVRIISKSI